MEIENKLKHLGFELPDMPMLAGNYVPYMQVDNLLFLSGAICMVKGKMTHTGKVGEERSLEYATEAAQVCVLNLLANAKNAIGNLDKIKRIINLTGYVNAIPGFSEPPLIINGASDLLIDLYGERGRHTRAAVAVTGLPKNSTVEISAIFEV